RVRRTATTCTLRIITLEPSTWTNLNEQIMCYPCPRTPVTHVSGPYTAAKKSRCRPAQGQRSQTDANTRKGQSRQNNDKKAANQISSSSV
ncbi:MAG TPA: hypothetical protein VIH96_15035, partial [Paraburkholderia sp.]